MRILGIDVGSTSIKAVELDSAFGQYEIHDYHEHPVVQGEDPRAAVVKLVRGLPKAPDRIAVALGPTQTTFRNLKVPSRDRKTIQTSVGFELEDDLPFPMEKTIYDYSILSQGKEGTELHAAATLRGHIASALEWWASVGLHPDLLTSESWAYRTLLSRVLSKQDQESPALLIQIGNARTTLFVHWKGSPVLAREIDWGGKDLTQAIAQKYNLSFQQAEQAKIDHGFVVPVGQSIEVTAEQMEFSENILATVQTLLVEIRQLELACKSLTQKSLSQIFVAGGSVLLPGLTRVIEESCKIPARPLQALSSIATSGVTYSEHTDSVFLLAAACALCMIGSDRSTAINFRKGEFAKEGGKLEFSVELIRRPLLSTAAIAACLVLSLVVRSMTYHKSMTEVDAQLDKNIKQFFGQISSSAIRNYLLSPTTLKNSITKELAKQRELAKISGPNPKDPLDYLLTLSNTVPKNVVTDLMQYSVGSSPTAPYGDSQESASLTFAVNDQQTGDKVGGLISSKLAGFKKDKTDDFTASDGTKELKVTFTGKPNYESR